MTVALAPDVRSTEIPDIVSALPRALAEDGVPYCHWKGRAKIGRPVTGSGDIDLLVDPADMSRLVATVARVGFKPAAVSRTQYPGTLSFYAPDDASGVFLHAHVHYQLCLGHWSMPVRVPLEKAVLATSQWWQGWRVPTPEFELLLWVLCKALAHRPAVLRTQRPAALPRAISQELAALNQLADRAVVHGLLETHLPFVQTATFDRCIDELSNARGHGAAVRRLSRQLRAQALRRHLKPLVVQAARRAVAVFKPAALKSPRRLVCGGRVIALIGGDGAGKSTAVDHVATWLAGTLDTRTFHLGRPPRSMLTLAVGAARRLALALHLEADVRDRPLALLRTVCTARDRYRVYRQVLESAQRGAVVLCDRYPLRGLGPDGPSMAQSPTVRTRYGRALQRLEAAYYARILPPDVLILLDVDPAIAARRKKTENSEYVRARTSAMRRRSLWAHYPQLHVVDADCGTPDVHRAVRRIVWAAL